MENVICRKKEHVYLIYEREFIRSGENVYKIGRTEQPHLIRINAYPKSSELLGFWACENSKLLETEILDLFCSKYKQRKEYGREYFEGNPDNMHNDIIKLIKKLRQKNVENSDEDEIKKFTIDDMDSTHGKKAVADFLNSITERFDQLEEENSRYVKKLKI